MLEFSTICLSHRLGIKFSLILLLTLILSVIVPSTLEDDTDEEELQSHRLKMRTELLKGIAAYAGKFDTPGFYANLPSEFDSQRQARDIPERLMKFYALKE
jgi:hypothetical protein